MTGDRLSSTMDGKGDDATLAQGHELEGEKHNRLSIRAISSPLLRGIR